MAGADGCIGAEDLRVVGPVPRGTIAQDAEAGQTG
jgi:hypothetical protein